MNIHKPNSWLYWLMVWLGIIICYGVLARICLELGVIGGTASPFWLPTGLVIALPLVFGYRVLPGIFLSQFLFSATFEPGPEWKHLMLSVGNVIEGATVCYLAPKMMRGRKPLASIRNFVSIFTAAGIGSVFNSLIGSCSLWLAGLIPIAALYKVMLNWSIGDLGGALIVAPLIFAWEATDFKDWKGSQLSEYLVLLLIACSVTHVVFQGELTLYSAPLAFVLLPLLLWSALRFGPMGCALLNALMTGIVIWGTTHGHGPFATSSATESLILIQVFTTTIIVTSLMTLIVSQDRRRMMMTLRQNAESLEMEVVQRTHQLTQELAERKKQEQALKVSKERLEAAAKAGIVGIWDWDVVKNQLIWDKVMYSLYGIREEDFGGAYEAWSATVHPDDKARVDDEIKAALSHEREYSPEFRVIWPDGSIHFLKAESHTSFDEQGKPLRIVGVNYDLTKQKIIEQELEDLYENAPCGYHSIGPDGIYQRINATELAWLGCTREEVIGKKSPCDFYTHPSQELFRQAFPNFVRDGYSENLEFDLVGKEGTNRHVIMNATAIRDGNGNFLNSRSVMYDITELKQIEDKLHQLTLEQHAMLDNELVGMAKLKNRHIVWKNKAFDGMFGYGAAELNGQSLRILYPDDAQFQAVGEVAYPILNAQGVYRTPLELLRKNGETIWVDSSSIKLNNVNEEFLWTIVDITPIKQHQEKIERIAYHDILTDLPNRLLLSDRLEQALAQTERLEKLLAVCYIDLDGFKPINDNFGHAAGDELLKEIANRMEGSVRTNDTVSRIGGDEFCLLLTNLENVQEYQTVLQRVIDSINKPVRLERGVEVNVTASIGITLFPFDTDDPDTLLRHADQAMYQAKKAGRNRVYLYSSDRTGGAS